MNHTPSDEFIAAIGTAYRAALSHNRAYVQPADLWDEIVIMCLRKLGGFRELFAWDQSKAKARNRIGTIRQCIAMGQVPGLRLSQDERGREVVLGKDGSSLG